MGPSMLRQMRGRAGRQGKAPVGETYLCCRQNDLEQVVDLLKAELPEATSCLGSENQCIQRYGFRMIISFFLDINILRRALLEVISVRLATSHESIRDYFSKSLLSRSCETRLVDSYLNSGVAALDRMGLITSDSYSNYVPTRLGKAIVASAIDPEDGLFVHRELSKALKAFVMDGEMHILYTFTPVQDFGASVNWRVFRNEVESLDDSGLRVLDFLGIKPTTILKL